MSQSIPPNWAEFLNPDVTRPRLIAASVYIAAFEALKGTIVERIRSFFCTGFDESGLITSPRYRAHVLNRNRSALYASLDWLKENNVIEQLDLDTFERLKVCRNRLAHELLSTLWSEGLPPNFHECLPELIQLFRKIEVWWVMNVEIPTNPDFDGQEIDEKEVIPGLVLNLQMLLDIALGDNDQSHAYANELRKRTGRPVEGGSNGNT